MSYSVTFEDKPGYLHARVTGSNSRENVLAYLGDVYKACVVRDSSVVLIEEYLLGPSIPLSSVFQVVDARAPRLCTRSGRSRTSIPIPSTTSLAWSSRKTSPSTAD